MSQSVDVDRRWSIATTLSPGEIFGAFTSAADSKRLFPFKLWRKEDASKWTAGSAVARARYSPVVHEHKNFPVVVCSATTDESTTYAELWVANGKVHLGERRRVLAVLEETVAAIKHRDQRAHVSIAEHD